MIPRFVALFILCLWSGLTKAQPTRFPIVITEGGLLIIHVNAEDSIRGKFILDTGAGIHVLSSGFLKRLHSLPAGRFTGFRHNGERIDLHLFQLRSFNIGRFRQKEPIVGVLALLDSFKIDGILSAKFFQHNAFTIDFADSSLIFETKQSLQARMRKTERIPLKLSDDREKSLDLFADFQARDSHRLECEIDTGSPTSAIDIRFAAAMGVDTSSSSVRRYYSKSLFGAIETRYEANIEGFSLRDAPNTETGSLLVNFKPGLIYDGLIGNNFWKGSRLTVNIPDKYILVQTR